ncbi:TonB-dependent receptor [Flavobacterium cyanobacteriorum]|uniref:TonB-dependent receptor n=1 Tax=Flavobacterium cyanobacteriorum TaxID=2022802 RepID=A0A255ZBX2_9FLAO|nr:outer membrane beta-barrel family protein [Flavobacterium cyanobacteriorum]OYQ38375.1 TonB-dependent receptor [Flavobacterium cyanobacteriorum]
MKKFQSAVVLILLFAANLSFAQNKVKIKGKVIEQDTKQPLEFANVTIEGPDNTIVGGSLTDARGEYAIEVPPGTYNIRFDFISFKPQVITGREITADTNLGQISLAPDATVLNEVKITAERSTVEIKLDKRVYTIGNDMMVKGGTVSDVLDNVPSLSVDAEGNVALRGNQNVTILIDGRPSTLAGSNVAEVLRLLPADSVDKVEVITNPSARYDAEGGGGIVNIILKKGKANGFNGSFVANTGDPDNHGILANLNFRSTNFNFFTNIGYNYRRNPGNAFINSRYLDEATNGTTSYTDERRENDRLRKGYNASFGLEWFLDKSLTWTNSVNFRRNTGGNNTDTYYDNYDAGRNFLNRIWRYNNEDSEDNNVQFSSGLVKKFNENGHELKVDASVSKNINDENAIINNITIAGIPSAIDTFERTLNDQQDDRSLLQADYVLPLGKDARFEAGYRGNFTVLETDARAERLNPETNTWENDGNFTNFVEYKEYINALYAQYGSKINKFSYMFGLRWEDSNIDVNLLTTSQFNNKRYNNFFPSAFFTYEFSENNNLSLSYSRRINRPRGRLLNPFSGLESNINVFQGNPDLDPSMTNSFDLGYLKRWKQLTLSTSAYLNITDDSFQYVRQIRGISPQGTPITLTTPINLAKEYRFGLEFNINYNPFKWWRINSNFNFFRNETQGDYNFVFTNPDTGITTTDFQDFNFTAYAWTTRVNSKITLPWKIDWQLNSNYEAPQDNAQGKRRGVISANTALSKDILKEKATIALNVQDIFNSRKMMIETYIPFQVESYSEMQWRVRQVTLSFTYRFNMSRAERQKEQQRQRQNQDGGGEEYMGG